MRPPLRHYGKTAFPIEYTLPTGKRHAVEPGRIGRNRPGRITSALRSAARRHRPQRQCAVPPRRRSRARRAATGSLRPFRRTPPARTGKRRRRRAAGDNPPRVPHQGRAYETRPAGESIPHARSRNPRAPRSAAAHCARRGPASVDRTGACARGNRAAPIFAGTSPARCRWR